jgi:hypothetical protein
MARLCIVAILAAVLALQTLADAAAPTSSRHGLFSEVSRRLLLVATAAHAHGLTQDTTSADTMEADSKGPRRSLLAYASNTGPKCYWDSNQCYAK